MSWSGGALKGTIGAGGLGVLAVWVERAEAVIGIWPLFAVAMAPFVILLFIRRGEVSEQVATTAHLIAVGWYGLLLLASLGLMIWRGFQPVDGLFGFFMALGVWPCVVVLRDIPKRR